jgi:hypothetical protein
VHSNSFTGRICNVKRDYPVSGSFTRVFLSFPLPLIEVQLYMNLELQIWGVRALMSRPHRAAILDQTFAMATTYSRVRYY